MNIECHIPKTRWNSGSTLANRVRAAVKAGTPGFRYYLPRGSIAYKVFVTVPLDWEHAPKVIEHAETVVLRDLDPDTKAALAHGGIVQAWASVYNRKVHGGTVDGLLKAVEVMKRTVMEHRRRMKAVLRQGANGV